MDKCREEFEKLEDVKDILEDHKNIFFDSKTNMYSAKNEISENSVSYPSWKVTYLNGAFYAFQHQQSKVEELQIQLSLQRQRVKAFEEELTSSRNYGDELQKRVDKAIRLLVEAELYQSEPNIDLAVKALKGEGGGR